MGVSRATFDAAFRGVEPDLSIPDLVLPGKGQGGEGPGRVHPHAGGVPGRQPPRRASPSRAARCSTQHAATLAKIEQAIGVQRHVVLAIWGRETAFGAHRSPHYAVQVLATQAWLGRRKEMFRTELLYALKMLEDKVRTRETMNASWAGAMGLTQFMPSEFYTAGLRSRRRRPQGHLGLGRRCAGLGRQPAQAKGWVPGQSWGYEVRLPPSLNCLAEGPGPRAPVARMGQARRRAHARSRVPGRRAGRAGLPADARRRLRPGLPGAREFPGHQALQHVGPLRAVRRQPVRPHRRRRRFRDAVGRVCASSRPRASSSCRSACRASAMRWPRSTARPA